MSLFSKAVQKNSYRTTQNTAAEECTLLFDKLPQKKDDLLSKVVTVDETYKTTHFITSK